MSFRAPSTRRAGSTTSISSTSRRGSKRCVGPRRSTPLPGGGLTRATARRCAPSTASSSSTTAPPPRSTAPLRCLPRYSRWTRRATCLHPPSRCSPSTSASTSRRAEAIQWRSSCPTAVPPPSCATRSRQRRSTASASTPRRRPRRRCCPAPSLPTSSGCMQFTRPCWWVAAPSQEVAVRVLPASSTALLRRVTWRVCRSRRPTHSTISCCASG